MDTVKYGSRVSRYRNMAGLTLDELASKIGIAKNSLVRFEKGTQFPIAENFIKICNVLDKSPDIMLQDGDKQALVFAVEEYCRLLNLTSAKNAVERLNVLFEKQE